MSCPTADCQTIRKTKRFYINRNQLTENDKAITNTVTKLHCEPKDSKPKITFDCNTVQWG